MSYRLDSLRSERTAGKSATADIGAGDDGTVTTTVTAVGVPGNAYTIEVEEGTGNNQPLAATIEAGVILVTLATDGAGDPDDAANTATLIAAEIDGLDGVSSVASGTGATAIDSVEGPTTFTGGREQYSLNRMAQLCGFSTVRLQEVEDGRPVDPEEAVRIADALGISLTTLGAKAL
jgi:hypothetical protein